MLGLIQSVMSRDVQQSFNFVNVYIRKSSLVQFDTLLKTRFSEVVGLLEEVGLKPHRNSPLEMMIGVAT